MKLSALAFVTTVLMAGTASATAPCDLKGVAVGDKIAPAELMAKLGITNFRVDPPFELDHGATDRQTFTRQYGQHVADEMLSDRQGNICRSGITEYCAIPQGLTIGESDIPVSAFIEFKSGTVKEIGFTFNAKYWNQIVWLLVNKFDVPWAYSKETIDVVDEVTKAHSVLSRTYMMSKADGQNPRTGDRCSIGRNKYRLNIQTSRWRRGTARGNIAITLRSINF